VRAAPRDDHFSLGYAEGMASPRARRFRVNQTEVEKRLWSRLRNRGLLGLKFRRQVPLGDFVADFVCADHALVVELDGGQHASSQVRDDRRTAWLEARGWRVLRFWNNEVNENIDGVLQVIAGACGTDVNDPRSGPHRRPHPGPLPQGEGEGTSRARPRRMLSRGYAPGQRD
jgi:very-short-patch-repair endonuclease